MEKEYLCKNILKDLNKDNVQVVVSRDIKGNYYSYLNNTVYLNGNISESNEQKAKEVVVVAHECIHAAQNKILHALNTVLSNIELLLFFVVLILVIFSKTVQVLNISYIFICISSIICRCVLEIPAMINSFNLAEKYCDDSTNVVLKENKKKLKYLLPLGILSFSWFRLLRLIFATII